MIKKFIKTLHFSEILFFFLCVVFSFWLAFVTFSYSDGSIEIATKAWSDFGSHIPLIRSFSFGDNIPPQDSLFPGSSIRYHYLFYALVGLLEKLGLRIDLALNIPSALGFCGLLIMMYFFAKKIFKNHAVAFLSVLFFLFNGSLSFLDFFKDHPFSRTSLFDIFNNTTFPSFAPYGKGIVSAFWNLNIYTNQRHLAPSYGFSLLIIYLLLFFIPKKTPWKLGIFLGIALGLSFFFNMAVFLLSAIIITGIIILFPKSRILAIVTLVTALILALPQYLTIGHSAIGGYPKIHARYLITEKLNFSSFFSYWFFNLGLHNITMFLGFLFAPKFAKKIFVCFFLLFLAGNLFQFSPEIAANHKFFNYFMIVSIMFSAYCITNLWKNKILKPLVPFLIFFLILSGIIDFFPIANDRKFLIADYPTNPEISWIMKHTNKNDIFLTSSYLYHPASLAGRKIFFGWPYFAWSNGYDTTTRDRIVRKMLNPKSEKELCLMLKTNTISYISIEGYPKNADFDINFEFFNKFSPVYKTQNGSSLYKTSSLCENL